MEKATSDFPDKLAEAKKEIEEWERNKGLACSHTKIPYEYTEKLLAATALISYERGREEQKKIDAEIVLSLQKHWDDFGYPVKGSQTVQREILKALKNKILISPSPDAK